MDVLSIGKSASSSNDLISFQVYQLRKHKYISQYHGLNIYVTNKTNNTLNISVEKAFYITHDKIQLEAKPNASGAPGYIGEIFPNLKKPIEILAKHNGTLINKDDLLIVQFKINRELYVLATKIGDSYTIEGEEKKAEYRKTLIQNKSLPFPKKKSCAFKGCVILIVVILLLFILLNYLAGTAIN